MQQAIKTYFPLSTLFALVYFSFFYGVEISRGGDIWKTGEWLINWYDYPVRRGMIGTFLLASSDYTGLPLLWVVFVTKVSFYLLIYYAILRIYYLKERDLMWWVILFSPAFILFPFYNLDGGFRKEIIVFSAFAYLCLYYARGTLNVRHIAVTALLFTLANFSHEPAAVSAPFFGYIFYRACQQKIVSATVARCSIGLFLFIATVSVIFSYLHQGTPTIAWAICRSVKYRKEIANNICSRAIEWVAHDAAYAANTIFLYLFYYTKQYFPAFLLSLWPLCLLSGISRDFSRLMVIGFLFVLPLFFIGIDWGRWIQIYVFFIFTILLAESVYEKIEIRKVPFVFVVLYLSTWGVSLCYGSGDYRSLIEMFIDVFFYVNTGLEYEQYIHHMK